MHQKNNTPATHTAGPWVIGENRHNYDVVIRNADNDPVASVFVAAYGPRTGKSNVALIASAPDLLESLKLIVDCHNGFIHGVGPCVCVGHEAARAAIAKAEGR